MQSLTQYEREYIRYSETEEVVIGGGVHVIVLDDHYTGTHIANHPRDEDDGVGYSEDDGLREVPVSPPEVDLQELLNALIPGVAGATPIYSRPVTFHIY